MTKQGYTHGGDVYRNKVKYDFSVNINPLGMPEKSIEAGKRAVELSQSYPDYMGEELCAKLSGKEGCNAENIIIGNGAAELIYALCQSVRPKRALIPAPTFTEYENAVRASGGEVVRIYANEDKGFEISSEDIISEICAHDKEKIDMLFLCNPNNPTGRLLSGREVCRIGDVCEKRGIRFIVDECFLPFCDGEEECTAKHDLEHYKKMCVLRAFTKIYAMPGLRLGYMLTADCGLAQGISRVLQPWNTSLPAQMAGSAALEDEDYIIKTRALINREREYLSKEISSFEGVDVYESNANFILFRVNIGSVRKNPRRQRDEEHVGFLYNELLERGILIRKCDDFEGLDFDQEKQYYRVAVRNHSENEALIRAMKEVL